MCGLVGIAGNIVKKDNDFFKQALICDQVRGAHSTGVIQVDKKNKAYTLKAAENPAEFVKEVDFGKMNTSTSKILAGHNRYATQGEVNDKNSHPFNHGNVTLMHNGTLYSRTGLDQSYFEVDSEHVAHSIGHAKDMDEVKTILEKLDGAFVLIWYNLDTDKLYFARNDERPLSIAFGSGTMYWASEEKMLDWLLHRNHLSVDKTIDLPVGEIWELDLSKRGVVNERNIIKTKFTPADTWDYGGSWNSMRSKTPLTPKTSPYSSMYSQNYLPVGYAINDYVEFTIDMYKPYGGSSKTGTVLGRDTENDQLIMIYSVPKEHVKLEADGAVDKAEFYCAAVTGTGTNYDGEKAVMLDKGTLISYGYGDTTEKKDTDTVYRVGNKVVTEEEAKAICNQGCGFCGHPIALDELSSSPTDQDGFVYHKQHCYQQAMTMMAGYLN